MKKYSSPKAELLKLSSEDIMTVSSGVDLEGTGEAGGELDFGDLLGGGTTRAS